MSGVPSAKHEAGADDQLEALGAVLLDDVLQRHMRLHHAGHRVAIGDADAGHAERQRRFDHLARVGGAAQEGEMRRRGEFGEAHANRPWRYQPGLGFSVP